MSLGEDIRYWIASNILQVKLNPAQAMIASSEGEADPVNIVDYQTAYNDIEVIHRAIEVIISGCVEIPFKIEGQGPIKMIDKLLNKRPNPFEDRVVFFRRAFLDFIIDGNVFFYYSKENEGRSIYILPANNVTVVPDPKTFVKGYKYQPNSRSDMGFGFSISPSRKPKDEEDVIFFTADEVIHIKNDSFDDIYRGDSKLKNINRLIELYYSMISFQRQFFQNNAIPGLVLQTDQILSTNVKERILGEWRNGYRSFLKGARSPAILDGGLKIDKFSTVNFQELDFESSIERIQQDMTKALGVPYVLLKSGNNANITNNQVIFYVHTVLPILQLFGSAFAHKFSSGPYNITISPDKHSITALRPDTRSEALYYSTLVNTGIITPNEARIGLRFPELCESSDDSDDGHPDAEDCNRIRVPQNITGSATNPSIGGRPATSGPQGPTGPRNGGNKE